VRSRTESWQPISPSETDELEADIPLAIPPPVTPHEALAHIEGLLLFSLQAEPTANINELQEALKREQKRIETLEIRRWQQHIQRRISDFLVSPASIPT